MPTMPTRGAKLMHVTCTFDIHDEDLDPKLKSIIATKGLPFKLWALWKKNHLTDQHFLDQCITFARHCEENEHPYSNIDDFEQLIRLLGLSSSISNPFSGINRDWLLKHWDYFNPNIRKAITIKYTQELPLCDDAVTTKTMEIR
jgi:hypothetical protein